jgi:dihydropteroate synthase
MSVCGGAEQRDAQMTASGGAGQRDAQMIASGQTGRRDVQVAASAGTGRRDAEMIASGQTERRDVQVAASAGTGRRDARMTASGPTERRDAQPQRVLRLGRRAFEPEELLVMAIVNRTPDSFYQPGVTWDPAAAMERVHAVVGEGADIVDVGGVPARPGDEVTVGEEIRRTVPFIAAVREAYPELVISVDTWRHEVATQACAAGADLINDTWGGWDAGLAGVAAEFGAGLVCSHAGGLPPRTRPFRVAYADVVDDVRSTTLALAARAVLAGVDPARILIDPAHDFGKNTWHSLEITRRLAELAGTGWPVLVSLSNKDFVGETLDAPLDERLAGTLATTAVSAWLGARVFRVHQVRETRHVLSMVSAIRGDIPPACAVRGLA